VGLAALDVALREPSTTALLQLVVEGQVQLVQNVARPQSRSAASALRIVVSAAPSIASRSTASVAVAPGAADADELH
jgi:hypothetical protein